jgi:REP element-mobilizing transposase RayT
MSAKEDIRIPLEPDYYYHIYNQGNYLGNVFLKEDNYTYFLRKLASYMSGYFKFYAYCLLPNHFHLLIKVKPAKQILKQTKLDYPNKKIPLNKELTPSIFAQKMASERLRHFFISYSKSINKQENRRGSLFVKIFRRKKVYSDSYLKELIWYIHNNPVKHNICKDYKDYQWSSYKSFLSNKNSLLRREEVLDWFENRKNFIAYHELRSKNEAF